MNNIAIIGASVKTDRYSNMAQQLLVEKGYDVYPVNPNYDEIDSIKCYANLTDINEQIDTLLIYMNPSMLKYIIPQIILKKPRRIIFNPGSENEEIENQLKNEGIEIVEACSLVLLKSNRF
jgi:predicted CoA-binding protein